LATISDALDPASAAPERLASLFVATLAVIREHPLLARLARVEPEALLAELTRDDSAVFRLVRDFLLSLIREGRATGELTVADPAALAEVFLRLGASFVLMPHSVIALDDEKATFDVARTLLAPLVTPKRKRSR
jgi:hypothetical protein